MGSNIVQALGKIMSARNDLSLAHDNRANGYFTLSKRLVRLLKGLSHILFVGHSCDSQNSS
jgi:hypothetical protein